MSIEVGTKLSGKVSGITNFGAFIDLGEGKTGLVHISEVSDQYIKDIKEVLKVGETVTVKVMTIGTDGKVGLSIRKAVDQPKQESSKPPYKKTERRGSTQAAPKKAVEPPKKQDFDSLMSSFLKDSDDRLTSLKRNTEGKRGGRGGRRN